MRLLETGTLLKLIVPMMCSSCEEKGGSIVINGLKIFKNLTLIKENNEYSKLQIGVSILVNLFKVDSYYKMTNLCIIAIGNHSATSAALAWIAWNCSSDSLPRRTSTAGRSVTLAGFAAIHPNRCPR